MKKVAVIINKERCHPLECAHECMKYDPLNRSGGEGFHLGEDGKAHIDEEVATDMHKICAKKCPFDAIKIVRLPEELKQDPIHQYGKNGFRIYNLPVPVFGKVVGLVGINGIGKSTAIRVLAGVLRPNLGQADDGPVDYDDLISRFKGTENQLFFERLKNGEIKVAYKPQQVELLTRTVSGTVGELLQKTDERNLLQEIAKELEIDHLLDRDITTISGGEVQRVAIAATLLRDANFYIFDEPSSYLDVRQRLNVARIIKRLADEKTAVLVIEHDLIILDYMTDLVHIMYGIEDVYGIIGLPRATKNGINTFLDGHLAEENIRFRPHKITFDKKLPKDETLLETLTSWTKTKKQYGDTKTGFLLGADAGSVFRNETVGVLGPNGIGKTTFIKILAGVEKSDEGSCDKKLTIAYKPQYIDTSADTTILELFGEVWEDQQFEIAIKRPFNLEPLRLHRLSELSGGQLQRIAIAHCLRQNADLYLLDEPSAYLDIEQRLDLAKTIRGLMEQRRKTAIIVDHDLLFLDYISDRLMVFDGDPGKKGHAKGPMSMQKGMTSFLKDVGVTFRRDEESNRPRANKERSQLDKEQKSENKYYYT